MNWLSHWDEDWDINSKEESAMSVSDDMEYEPITLEEINKLFGEDN